MLPGRETELRAETAGALALVSGFEWVDFLERIEEAAAEPGVGAKSAPKGLPVAFCWRAGSLWMLPSPPRWIRGRNVSGFVGFLRRWEGGME